MASHAQTQRVLTGGLNLLPPSDLIAPSQSRDLLNWRVDTAGALRTRKGRYRESTRGGVHSLHRRGEDRYAVTNGTLYTLPDLSVTLATGLTGQADFASFQGLTWVMNPAKRGVHGGGSAPFRKWLPDEPTGKMVATPGAERVAAIAEFSASEAWDVTRWANGVRTPEPDIDVVVTDAGTISATRDEADITGSGTTWTPDMAGALIRIDSETPRYAVVDEVNSETSITLNDVWPFDDQSGLAYRIYRTIPAKTYESGVSGDALAIRCGSAGRWQAEADFGARDLRFAGEARDEDVFRLWVSADNPAAVSAIRVTLLSGGGGVREAVVATIPGSSLSPVEGGWAQARVSRRADPYALIEQNPEYQDMAARQRQAEADGRSIEADQLRESMRALFGRLWDNAPYFRSATNPNGGSDFDWANVTGMWVEAEVTEATTVRFDQAQFVGRVPGSLSGTWTFWVSFSTDDGHETNGAAACEPVRLDNQPVTLSSIPISADPQVSMRHIYGVGPGVEEPLRFHTIADNAATAITLNIDVRDVQDRGTGMVTDADPPPAARGLLGPYFQRLVAWNSDAEGARIWWTPKDRPWAWPGADDDNDGNWIDAGDRTDPIMAITDHGRMLVVFKRRSIWRVNGDIDQAGVDPERTAASTGARGPRCVCTGGGMDYFLGAEGVYLFDGQREVKISADLDPLFRGEWARLSSSVLLPPIDSNNAGNSVMAYRAGRVYLSYPHSGNASPSATLVYDTATKQWARDSGAWTALYDEGPDDSLMGAAADGLYALETGDSDAGAAIPVSWQSPAFNQGLPNHTKVYSDLQIEFSSPSPLTVKVVYDDDTIEALTSIASNGRTTTLIPLAADGAGRRAKMVAVKIEGGVSAEAVLYGVAVHWYPEERAARSFDSGVIDLGGAARVVSLEMEVTAAKAPVTWAVDTDNLSGGLSERERGTVGATARQTLIIPLKNRANGRLARVRMWSAGDFQAHAVVLHVERFALGLAAGETWAGIPRSN